MLIIDQKGSVGTNYAQPYTINEWGARNLLHVNLFANYLNKPMYASAKKKNSNHHHPVRPPNLSSR